MNLVCRPVEIYQRGVHAPVDHSTECRIFGHITCYHPCPGCPGYRETYQTVKGENWHHVAIPIGANLKEMTCQNAAQRSLEFNLGKTLKKYLLTNFFF
jgi:hypothetical protein